MGELPEVFTVTVRGVYSSAALMVYAAYLLIAGVKLVISSDHLRSYKTDLKIEGRFVFSECLLS